MSRWSSLLCVGSAVLGCTAQPPPATHPVTVTPSQKQPAVSLETSDIETLSAALAAGARYGDSPPPRVLYTWTRPDQIMTLRGNPRLLIRSRSVDGVLSLFDTVLATDPSPLARLLKRPGLSLRRYAWSNPWATLAGWEGESYGDQLVRVELKPEALVLYYDPTSPGRWRATNLRGGAVSAAMALANPQYVAAVYHVYPGNSSGGNTTPFREFVLVNESMIARWEYATPAVRDELAAARALLQRLTAYAEHHPAAPPADPVAFWRHAPDEPSTAELYAANLTFPNAVYQLDPGRVASLAERVDAALAANVMRGLSITPSARFDASEPEPEPGAAPVPKYNTGPTHDCDTMPCKP